MVCVPFSLPLSAVALSTVVTVVPFTTVTLSTSWTVSGGQALLAVEMLPCLASLQTNDGSSCSLQVAVVLVVLVVGVFYGMAAAVGWVAKQDSVLERLAG